MLSQKRLKHLYLDSKMSMFEIATDLDVSVSTVNWWMKKYQIPKRLRSDANYEKYNKNGDPFIIKKIASTDDAILYGIGVGLFWGEGNKVSTTSLRLGNTDPALIKNYLRFLREFCGVQEEKIRFGLQIFNDSNPVAAKKHWISELAASEDQFMPTISIIASQGKGTYRKKNQYGVVTVYVNNIKLVDWMHVQLENFSKPR